MEFFQGPGGGIIETLYCMTIILEPQCSPSNETRECLFLSQVVPPMGKAIYFMFSKYVYPSALNYSLLWEKAENALRLDLTICKRIFFLSEKFFAQKATANLCETEYVSENVAFANFRMTISFFEKVASGFLSESFSNKKSSNCLRKSIN